MKLEIASKKQVKIRLALQGESGTGKTLSALLLAYGICGHWSKIALIDTEDGSASFYSYLGPYNTLQIAQFFQPINYLEAIALCETSGIEVIILDSISPEWVGEFGIADQWSSIKGDKYRRWDEVMQRHREFINGITHSPCHIIATVRTVNGKPQQQKGYEHNFTTVLSINSEYIATSIKDRTGIFKEVCPIVITAGLGTKVFEWCQSGEPVVPEDLQQRIDNCSTRRELYQLMLSENIDAIHIAAFTKKRMELDGLINDHPEAA